MNNYFSRIASRSNLTNTATLLPAHQPVSAGLADPFVAATPDLALQETLFAAKQPPFWERHPQQVQSPAQNTAETSSQPIWTVPRYLSKHVERNQSVLPEASAPPADAATASTAEMKTAAIPRSKADSGAGRRQVENQQADDMLPPKQKESGAFQSIQKTRTVEPLKKTTVSHSREPSGAERWMVHARLQPLTALPGYPGRPTKEKTEPKLVIGQIIVEVIPAQKPVNTIIRQSAKQPLPVAAPRSRHSFGMGQL